MNQIAQIEAGVVANVIQWETGSPYDPTAGGRYTMVDITALSPRPGIGATYSGGAFGATPAPARSPDPNGFGAAVMGDSSITLSVRLLVASWVPALALALQAGNAALVSTTWSDLVTQYTISVADHSAVAAHASACGVPGIS